jgi:hypothetical protein
MYTQPYLSEIPIGMPKPKEESNSSEEKEQEIVDLLLECLAETKVKSVAVIRQQYLENENQIEFRSPVGIAVLSRFQKKVGRKVPGLHELKREVFTSINSLAKMIANKFYGFPASQTE